jgi:hypothetical protein
VTLAIGASVPTTNEAPVGVVESVEVEEFVVTPLQPATSSEPTVIARSEGRKVLPCVLKCISVPSLSAFARGLHGSVAGMDTLLQHEPWVRFSEDCLERLDRADGRTGTGQDRRERLSRSGAVHFISSDLFFKPRNNQFAE